MSSNHWLRTASGCAVWILVHAGCSGGCGLSGESPSDAAAGTGGVSATYTGSSTSTAVSTNAGLATTGSAGADAGPMCEPRPIPRAIPDGWVEYTDWSCNCRFYVPTSKDVLPAPIAWEPCPAAPNGISCKVMVADWTSKFGPLAANPYVDRNPDGTAVLSITRVVSPWYSIHLVADADGQVHSAVMFLWEGTPWAELGCYLHNADLNEGKHIIKLRGDDLSSTISKHQGAMGGSIDELHPPILAHDVNESNPVSDAWWCSQTLVAKMTYGFVVTVYPWDMSSETFVTSPATDPMGMQATDIFLRGNAQFWTTGNLKYAGINVWDPVGGTRPFIRWINDYTKGAGNLGTDGVDLVWSYGEGKAPNDTVYPTRSIMTAPFTTDPAKLQPRRLRSQVGEPIIGSGYKVGCGYAITASGTSAVHVVRLSDGWGWVIPNTADQTLYKPLGVTCDEVFVSGTIGGRSNIARVRLDSLGPGTPPD